MMDFAQEAGINFVNMANRLDEIFPGHRTAPEDYAWYRAWALSPPLSPATLP
jgi:hypothetical protein